MIRTFCVIGPKDIGCGHWMDHKADLRVQWTNLTLSYTDRIEVRLVLLLYHCMYY